MRVFSVVAYVVGLSKRIEAGFRHHIAHEQQWLLDNNRKRFMQLDASDVNIERSVQTLRETQVRVEKHFNC